MKNWRIFRISTITVLIFFLMLFVGLNLYPGSQKISMATGPVLQQEKNLQPEIVPGFVVVKIRSAAAAQSLSKAGTGTGLSSLDTRLRRFNAISVQKMFRHKPIPPGSGIPDISRILKIRIPEQLNPVIVAHELERDPNVEYAEPVFVRRPCAVPNDSRYNEQQYLSQIHAPEAWDVQKGDSNVVIAIVDDGVDYRHEDLIDNVWTNEPEADGVTGVDDDGNGFVDDIHGWDFGDNDADPTNAPSSRSYYDHGTHVAGIACASTNNQKGVAGTSWNCEFMPVKVSPDADPGDTPFGAEGIVYSVDNGADIISNSWRGHGRTKWEQEAINYAYSKGAIIVAAAMNGDSERPGYPASYQHVISVAAVKENDTKTSYSNYGPWIDLCAPGGDEGAYILSTIPGNQYKFWGGTSMATPVVSGVFGLVKSLHPDWNNDRIIRQVLLTADNIDAVNPQFLNKLGQGRVNAYRAMTVPEDEWQEPHARLAVSSNTISDSLFGNGDGIFERGETFQVYLEIQNCSIAKTDAAALRLSSSCTGLEILNGTLSPVSFPADTTLPFDFNIKVTEDAAADLTELILTLEAGGTIREERFEITIGKMPVLFVDNDHPLFADLPDNEVFFRDILDKNPVLYDYRDAQVSGFPGPDLLAEFPIVILSTPWLGNFIDNQEYSTVQKYLDQGNSLLICGQDIGMGLYDLYGSEEAKNFMRNYLHAEYIANASTNPLVLGMDGDAIGHSLAFFIWEPGWSAEGQAADVISPTAGASSIFTYLSGGSAGVRYAGAHKVVYLPFGLEAVDSDQNTQTGDLSPIRTLLLMRILDWLSFIEHEPLTDTENTDTSRTVMAGITTNITDVEEMTLFWRVQGMNDFSAVSMAAGDSSRYSAEIPAQDNGAVVEYYVQAELPYYHWTSPVGAPETVYSYHVGVVSSCEETPGLPVVFRLKHNYPNPFNPTTAIEYDLPRTEQVRLVITDILGRQVKSLLDSRQSAGHYRMTWDGTDDNSLPVSAGLYFCRMEAGEFVKTVKLVLVR
jgi:subtilisin family serine protease